MNWIQSLLEQVNPDMLGQVAGHLGEAPEGVQRALGGIIPTILGSLAGQSGNTDLLGKVLDQAKSPEISGDFGSMLGGLLGGGGSFLGPIQDLLGSLFGDKLGGLSDLLAGFSGLKGASISTLLSLAGGLIMNFLGKKANTEGLSASGLGDALNSQKAGLMGMLPAGAAGLLGLGAPVSAAAAQGVSNAANAAAKAADMAPPVSGGSLIMPIIVALAGVGAIYFGTQNCKKPEVAQTPAVAAPEKPKTDASAAPAAGAANLTLPGGQTISGNVGGIEDALFKFIQDPEKVVDKTTWFDFDQLNFDTGKATLQSGSMKQIENIAAIMSAYQNVKLKIGGYTDNTGNEVANLKLSAMRAKTVMDAIIGLGIPRDRLESEGYGSQHPIGDNNTEEGRAKNRRISVRVTAK